MMLKDTPHDCAASHWACGCITGIRLCRDAVNLLQETRSAFERSRTVHDFSSYDSACRAFDAHYAMQELESSMGNAY
jgi:hypothetical protein